MKTAQCKLNGDDLKFLLAFTKTGNRNSKEFERAYILLALHKEKKQSEIDDFYNVSRTTTPLARMFHSGAGADLQSVPFQTVVCNDICAANTIM